MHEPNYRPPSSYARGQTKCTAIITGLLLALLAFAQLPAFGQVSGSMLAGTVYDESGAVIPDATVVIKNQTTNATSSTVSNNSGYFSFPFLQAGTYTVSVSAKGFTAWEGRDIVLSAGQSKNLPHIALKVATETTTVEVVANASELAPVSTGESRSTLNQRMVSQLMIQGRNAAELVKIMPGMGIIGQGSQLAQTQYSSLTTQSNSGVVGQYSANGTQPYGGMQVTIDGGVIVDTGNMGTQTANINQDQTAELTIRSSAFDAQYAHGPVSVEATSKGGGSDFHGDAYMYMRNGSLNAAESYFNAQDLNKPIDHYWYPGFDVGGPVLIPGSDFNRNRDKLFFYGAYENMIQHPIGSLTNYLVPTTDMLAGDFSASALAPFQGYGFQTAVVPCDPGNNGQWWYGNFCSGAGITGGNLASYIDPNGLAYMKTMPSPNADPARTGGFNYQYLNQYPINRWEMKLRGDYNITQNTRAYVSYDRQSEKDINPIGVWWWPNGTLPYPTQFPAQQITDLWSASVTHIFGPSLTNEVTFNYTSFINPLKFSDPSKVDPSAVGMNVTLPFDTGTTPMIPNSLSWSGGSAMPTYFAPAFSSEWQGGSFGALKRVPSISDNLAWVKGSHTMKFGFYWARWGNQQTEGTWDANSGFPQGRFEFENYANNTTGNPLADMLIGHAQSFAQTSADPVHTLWFTEMAFYAQDQWKVNRRLTLNYGLRFDWEGQWAPSGDSPGLMVWDPSTCADSHCVGADLPGLTWHGRNSSVPISGYKSKLFPDPRVGVAYDLFGNGKTVVRGGFGIYRYQFAYNSVTGGIIDGPLGIQAFQTTCTLSSWAQAGTDAACQPTSPNGALPASSSGLSETALSINDDRTPYTQNWNVLVDHRLPWNSMFEIGYVGSRSRNLLLGGNSGNNVNKIPLGAYFSPDPVTGDLYCLSPSITTGCVGSGVPSDAVPHYRLYNYNSIQVNTHGSWANYNALQASWQKQTGRTTLMLNYTWSKTMGLRDGQTDNGTGANGAIVDRFNIPNNYGVLGYDRTHIFNAAYVIQLPDFLHGDTFGQRVGKGFVNGWQIAGITQIQSGTPIQPNTGGNLNASYPGGYNNQSLLGTPDQVLMPILTCDPRSGLADGQYFNPNCFALPTTPGQNGPVIWPTLRGPAYVGSDLGVYKNFNITERQKLQFRFQAFNFMNHPLADFTYPSGSTSPDLTLSFQNSDGSPSATNTNSALTGMPAYTTGRRVIELSIKYMF